MNDLPFNQAYKHHRPAALALLNSAGPLTWKAGQFLGGIVTSQDPLSERQADWLNKLLSRAGLPSYDGGAGV